MSQKKQANKDKSLEFWIRDAACSIRGAMVCMNRIIHDMEGEIEVDNTFKNPKFRDNRGKLRTFDRVVANPMWNRDWFTEGLRNEPQKQTEIDYESGLVVQKAEVAASKNNDSKTSSASSLTN